MPSLRRTVVDTAGNKRSLRLDADDYARMYRGLTPKKEREMIINGWYIWEGRHKKYNDAKAERVFVPAPPRHPSCARRSSTATVHLPPIAPPPPVTSTIAPFLALTNPPAPPQGSDTKDDFTILDDGQLPPLDEQATPEPYISDDDDGGSQEVHGPADEDHATYWDENGFPEVELSSATVEAGNAVLSDAHTSDSTVTGEEMFDQMADQTPSLNDGDKDHEDPVQESSPSSISDSSDNMVVDSADSEEQTQHAHNPASHHDPFSPDSLTTTADPIYQPRIPLSARATPPSQQRTLAHELPISPPDTPETHRAQLVETTATNTPTQVGKFFATQIASPPPETLDSAWNAEKRTQIQQMYQVYLASKGIHVGEDSLTDYMSRCATVARMIVVSPPSDLKYSQRHKLVLGMMFSNSPRDLSVLSQTLAKSFGDYVAENGITGDSLTVNLAARLSALTAFQNDLVHAPQNMCWMFLVMHQLVYEKIAEKYPEFCGYAGAAQQRIHQAVNHDIQRIFAAALGHDVSVQQRKDWKRAISYVLRFSIHLVSSFAGAVQSASDTNVAYYYATLATAIVFQQLSRSTGFGVFSQIGGIGVEKQREITETVVAEWTSEPTILRVLQAWYPDVTPHNLQPYVTATSHPNVFSFLHLIAQSIVNEHKYVTYEMIEKELELPNGFLGVFEREDMSISRVARLGLQWVVDRGRVFVGL